MTMLRSKSFRTARILPLTLAAICLIAATSSFAATLRPDPVAAGAEIRLGDIFVIEGLAAAAYVAPAPAPGRALDINAASLKALAASHGLDWPNAEGRAIVSVRRAARRIEAAEITDAIRVALSLETARSELDVRLAQPGAALLAPSDSAVAPAARILAYEPRSGRFEAEISAPGAAPLIMTGLAFETMPVPVLARALQRGETVSEADLDYLNLRIETLARTAVTDPAEMIGLAAKRPLRSGQPLLASDFERAIIVKKGATVTMTYTVPGMALADSGRALEQGGIGDTISVLNPRSHRTLLATITGPDSVALQPSVPATIIQSASNAR